MICTHCILTVLLVSGLWKFGESFAIEKVSKSRAFSLTVDSSSWRLSVKAYDDLSGEEGSEGSPPLKNKKDTYNKRGKEKFAKGEELLQLREDLLSLRENLQWAEATEDASRIEDLRQAIESGEQRDPDLVYEKTLRLINEMKLSSTPAEEKRKELKALQQVAQEARVHLKRFNLEGLWVGSYGERGEQLVNVTYIGDTIVATKVTGDINVPRGEVSFTANLAPQNASALEPLKVSFDRQASTQLPRFLGKGQIAKAGFQESKYVDGQFVLFDKHFSFVWIPSRHHVLFRRPTPTQIIELMRDDISKEDELGNMRSHISRCFEMDMTESLARFHADEGPEPFRRILQTDDLKSFKPQDTFSDANHSGLSLFKMKAWRSYFDMILGDEKKKRKE